MTSKKTSQTSCKRYTKAISFQKDITDLLPEIHQGNQLPKRHRRPPARDTLRQSASKKTSQTSCKRYTKAISFQKDIADLLQEIHQGNQLPKRHRRPPARDTPRQSTSKKTSQTSCKRYTKAISFQKDIPDHLQEIHQGNQLPKRHRRPPARDTPRQSASKKTSQTSCKRYTKAISFQKDIADLLQAIHQGNQLPKRHRRPPASDTPRQSASKKTSQTSCKRYTKAISFQKDIADLLQEIHQGNQLPKRHRRPPASDTLRQSASKKTSQTSCKRYTKAISFQKDIADLLQEIHQGNQLPKRHRRFPARDTPRQSASKKTSQTSCKRCTKAISFQKDIADLLQEIHQGNQLPKRHRSPPARDTPRQSASKKTSQTSCKRYTKAISFQKDIADLLQEMHQGNQLPKRHRRPPARDTPRQSASKKTSQTSCKRYTKAISFQKDIADLLQEIHQGNQLPKRHRRPPARDTPRQSASKKTSQTSCKRYTKAISFQKDIADLLQAIHQGNQLPKRHRRPPARDTPRQAASKKTSQTSCKRYTKAISFQKDIADLLQEIHQGNQLPKRHRRPPARDTPRQSASKKTSQTSCKRYTKAISFQKDIADLLQEIHQGNQLPKRHRRPPARDTPRQSASKKTSQTSCKRYTKAISFQKDIADLLQEIHQGNQLPKRHRRPPARDTPRQSASKKTSQTSCKRYTKAISFQKAEKGKCIGTRQMQRGQHEEQFGT